MSLLVQIALLLRVVHTPSLLVLVVLWLELADSHMQHVDPGLTILQRLGKELEHSVDHHQVKPVLLVHFLQYEQNSAALT